MIVLQSMTGLFLLQLLMFQIETYKINASHSVLFSFLKTCDAKFQRIEKVVYDRKTYNTQSIIAFCRKRAVHC